MTYLYETDPEDKIFLSQALHNFNQKFTCNQNFSHLNLYLTQNDRLVAAFKSLFFWGCLDINQFWIDEKLKNSPLSDYLFDAINFQAYKAKVNQIYSKAIGEDELLPYKNRGFSVYGTIPDRPPGFNYYYLSKTPDPCSTPYPPVQFTLHQSTTPNQSLDKSLADAVSKYQNSRYKDYPFEFFGYKALDQDNYIIAGITGYFGWNWLYIDTLWVREDARHQKLGSKLLARAEELAKSYQISSAFLGTTDFQAPDFYLYNGYKIFATRHNFPPNHTTYSLFKSLT